MGDFPALNILLDWNPNINWLRNIVIDGSPNHVTTTQTASGDVFARFLRARDPVARVLRVSVYNEHARASHQNLPTDPKLRAEAALLRIVSSLVFNLVSLVPARFQAHDDLQPARFEELKLGRVDAGIAILKALPKLDLGRNDLGFGERRKRLMVIIDGIDLAFDGDTTMRCRSLQLVDALECLRKRNGEPTKFIWTAEKRVPGLFPDPYL
jgi:hypothetical protein